METIGIFLRKAAYLTLSSAVVPALLSRLHQPANGDGDEDEDNTGFARSRGETAKILLDMISTSCSVMLKPHIDKLTKALFEVSEVESTQTTRLIDACLLGLSELAKTNSELIPSEPYVVFGFPHMALTFPYSKISRTC